MNTLSTYTLPSEPSSRFKAGSIGEKNQQKVLEAALTVFSRKGFQVLELMRLQEKQACQKLTCCITSKQKKSCIRLLSLEF